MSANPLDPERRLDAKLALTSSSPAKRMLIIVNPYATTVSDRLKHLVVYALRGRYLVDAVDTERRDHATELCRTAAQQGYDVVVAFGGDGTVNEAANGLAGSGVPLTCLPGGRANVYCRMLGIPGDVVDATEHLLAIADDWRPRAVDLGLLDERFFLFSAGVGLDASVVERVDAHPGQKARAGEYYYAWVASRTYVRHYLLHPPRLEARFDTEQVAGVSLIVQNADPYTFFGDRPVQVGEGVALDSGDLAGAVLKRTNPLDIPMITWRALSARARVAKHRQIYGFTGVRNLHVRTLDARALPVQVDGDYIGERDTVEFTVMPGGLTVVA
ncbi:MAG: diacylglycerol/lipid kinase family protein [Solirubrobacteraceae bacterium]